MELGFHEKHKYSPYDLFLQKRANEYQILTVIGQGTFGIVYRGRDKKTGEIVAMKEEVEGLTSPSTLMEINILKFLPRHPSIVAFKNVATEGARVFVVMEYMKYDLERAMAAKGKPLSLMQIKFLMQQILKGVRFLHDNGVMHRDLKPANILLGDNNVKICDFNLSARLVTRRSPAVGTRFYKAPELLMGSRTCSYTCAVDMWSVGCIMAELVLDQPLFQGRSDAEQLECIRSILCSPINLLHLKVATAASFSGAAALTRSGHDLLERLLAYDPSKRISAGDALNHAWFRQVLPRTCPVCRNCQ